MIKLFLAFCKYCSKLYHRHVLQKSLNCHFFLDIIQVQYSLKVEKVNQKKYFTLFFCIERMFIHIRKKTCVDFDVNRRSKGGHNKLKHLRIHEPVLFDYEVASKVNIPSKTRFRCQGYGNIVQEILP